MAAALGEFNASFANGSVRSNAAHASLARPLVARKAVNVMELIRAHR
jgi:hypothetical protein